MKTFAAKAAVNVNRQATGVPPPTPDSHAAPRSAHALPKKDATSSNSSADLDRSRRLARSDPQARYGNSEVARVAMGQNPPPVGGRRVAARPLPQAGPVAAKGKRGHGKPSSHPGAAKAAIEAKHKGDKQAAETRKDAAGQAEREKRKKEEPQKGKPSPADGGAGEREAGGKKESKEEAGSAERGGAEGAAEAAGGGGPGAEELLPPPRPRLDGTAAVMLSIPQLADQQRERIRSQTGFTVAEHYARVQVHLDRLSARATSEQLAIVLHIELLESEVRRDLDNAVALIAPAVKSGIDTVRGACSAARTAIKTARQNALNTIEGHATAADKAVDTAAISSKEAVEKAVAASSPAIRALYDETMAPLRELLKKTGEQFVKKGEAQGKAMSDQGKAIKDRFVRLAADPIDEAINEKKGDAAVDQAETAKKDLIAAGERGKKEILGQEASLGMSFLMLVNPVAVKVEKVAKADGQTAQDKGEEVRLRLTTDYERAVKLVEETTDRAVKALDALEKSAVRHMQQMGRSLEEMARARRDQVCNSILASREPAADAWRQQMSAVNDLVAGDQIVDWRKLEPRFVEAMASMNTLSTRQRLEYDAQARSGFDETRAGMDGDRHSIDESVDSYVDSVRDTRRQAVGIGDVANTIAKGFLGATHHATKEDEAFRTKAEEKLGLSVDATRKQMSKLLGDSKKLQDESVINFDKALGGQVKGLEASLAKTFDQVAKDVPEDLARRAGQAYRAMDKVGTDETGLFEALHGMTPTYGRALTYYWSKRDTHTHTLWWWLDDELSGDEYTTAEFYLLGDPVIGARYEIKAGFHWYGDDVAQMESALRALSPKQLEQLNNDPAFKEIKEKLQKELKGTNLQVTNALLAGRTARADALRLKDQIDAARAAGNDDKLHDLLSQLDQRLPEVRTEFVDITAGHAMTAERPAKPKDAEALKQENADFVKYITRPVQGYERGHGREDPGHYVTRTLSEPSRKLAEALATTGEGSPESRAARLAYEASRGGKPRPERLAKALDDPELIAARNNPILKQPNADPKELDAAQKYRAQLEARRADMMTKFAELRKADAAIQKDPKRAQEYTEKAVADMFGKDDLGRELGESMVREGRATPAVAIKYAVRGWGTNEELIRKTLRGMSREEIEALKVDYAKRYGGEGKDQNKNQLFDDLGVFQNADTAKAAGVEHATGGGFFTELSGDERQEVEELLLGTPKNDRDKMRLARLKYAHQRVEGTTWVGTGLMAVADADPVVGGLTSLAGMGSGTGLGKSLDMNKARMEEMVVAAGGEEKAFDKDGNFKGVPGRFSVTDFRVHTAATSEMAENYKHHIDSLVDMITGAIALIGAIVGTIVVTVLTLGTATPAVIGLWAAGIAAATGAAVMATKYALKGSRYGWEEAAVDAAITLVDAATAGLTAGAGARGARAVAQAKALEAAARTPAQKLIASNVAKQAVRKETARQFVRSAAGAGVSGTARTAMTDGVWDDGFMTGLGRSLGGGARAAVIAVAAHGAGYKYGESKYGKALAGSSSYFKRGLGSGLGGALGGMAGTGAELTLDSLGGHAQGPWYETFGKIALAGGRGFAENFGHGIAQVSKERRDKVEANLRSQREGGRPARVEVLSDEAADLKFRRMAAEVAKANDPKTNLRGFLSELDAAVAQDRSVAETTRQLVRSFRREALAAIPPARRGEFADVPIHIVPDAEFEKLTGSATGRAVTMVEDGEARIVVRKGATPDTLREEGIHVLQSRDPDWRGRVAKLDEATMRRWHELDLETQLSLYREKLEIELDAHQRLRRNLIDEADRTSDPKQRKALLARVEETEQTFKALKARRDEVDLIGPERIDAMRQGTEARPQYLREPARLFAKKPSTKVATEEPSTTEPPTTTAPKKAAAPKPPVPELTEAQKRNLHLEGLRDELVRLQQIDPAERTATENAKLTSIDAEIKGHYVLGPNETIADLQARVLPRREGETDFAYGRRLVALKGEVTAGAAQLGKPELREGYERLVLSLKRPLDAVRAELDALRAIPRETRTQTQSRRLATVLDELDAHYDARPGEPALEVEARILGRRPQESDAEYRQRLQDLRANVDESALMTRWPNMLGRLDNLIVQMRRPMAVVRAEIDELVLRGRDLTDAESKKLGALQEELQSHYLERPGETVRQLEDRLFAQRKGESIDDYLVRLRNMENEVASGVERTGSENVLNTYFKILGEVEADIARRPALEVKVREAREEYEAAERAWWAHRAARLAGRKAPNLPTVSTAKLDELHDTYVALEAELKSIETRSAARSARYTFADLGRVDPCFLPGTPIVTPGGPKAIESLVDGDLVMARLPGELPVPARIARVHRSATQRVVTLGLSGDVIRTTGGHPFWSENDSTWKSARDLVAGDVLLTLIGPQRLDTVTIEDELQPTLNLEVEGMHTFLVGAAGALVHNGTKRPGFDDPVKRPTRIYRVIVVDDNGEVTVIYVGKTWQGGKGDAFTRFEQHLATKADWAKLRAEKGPDGLPRVRIEVEAEGNWTVFETAVWEEHTIRKYRLNRGDLEKLAVDKVDLENKGVPVTKETFNRYRSRFQGC
jgi:hypothetical protein